MDIQTDTCAILFHDLSFSIVAQCFLLRLNAQFTLSRYGRFNTFCVSFLRKQEPLGFMRGSLGNLLSDEAMRLSRAGERSHPAVTESARAGVLGKEALWEDVTLEQQKSRTPSR